MLSLFRRWRLHRLLVQPIDASREAWLREHVRAYTAMQPKMRRRLEQITTVIITGCHWEGCDGLELTEEMQTVVAGHAAVMLLGAQDYYFESVTAILIFPGTIRRRSDGRRDANVGEAWDNGGIVLSWPEVKSIGRMADGQNVVIHEFAHHLDGRDGEMGGSIPFNSVADQARWDRVATHEFERLVDAVRQGKPTLIDRYGATNEAEFFAVCSECFFEQPHRMSGAHAELYEMLVRFYQIDPREWGTR